MIFLIITICLHFICIWSKYLAWLHLSIFQRRVIFVPVPKWQKNHMNSDSGPLLSPVWTQPTFPAPCTAAKFFMSNQCSLHLHHTSILINASRINGYVTLSAALCSGSVHTHPSYYQAPIFLHRLSIQLSLFLHIFFVPWRGYLMSMLRLFKCRYVICLLVQEVGHCEVLTPKYAVIHFSLFWCSAL